MRSWLVLAALVAVVWLVRWLVLRWYRTLHGTPLSGRLVENHPNGRIRSERNLLDGMMHGPWYLWDDEGNKLSGGAYDHGIVHGREIDYGPNGVKIRETPWVHGRRHGTATVYDPASGKVVRELCFIHADTDKPAHDGPCSDAEIEQPAPDAESKA